MGVLKIIMVFSMKNNRYVTRFVAVLFLQFAPFFSLFSFSSLSIFSLFSPAYAAITPYDFGTFVGTSRSMANNPALSLFCDNQINVGLANRSSDITMDTPEGRIRPEQLGSGYGALELGGCFNQVKWAAFGGYLNLATLSFDFTTQSQQTPMVFPYNKNFLPLGAFGGGVKLTEDLFVGLSWKVIERVDIDIDQSILPEFRTRASADVRPSFTPVTGAAYRAGPGYWHLAYSPEVNGLLDVDMEIPVEFDFNQFDFSVIVINGAISYIPAQTTLGYWWQGETFSLDMGLMLERWSKLEHIFWDVSLPLGLEVLFYEELDVELKDTVSPFFLLERPIMLRGRYPAHWQLGFAYRESVVPSDASLPLVGADLYAYKTGLSWAFDFLQYKVHFDGQFVYGYLDRTGLSEDRTIEGDMLSIGLSLRMNF